MVIALKCIFMLFLSQGALGFDNTKERPFDHHIAALPPGDVDSVVSKIFVRLNADDIDRKFSKKILRREIKGLSFGKVRIYDLNFDTHHAFYLFLLLDKEDIVLQAELEVAYDSRSFDHSVDFFHGSRFSNSRELLKTLSLSQFFLNKKAEFFSDRGFLVASSDSNTRCDEYLECTVFIRRPRASSSIFSKIGFSSSVDKVVGFCLTSTHSNKEIGSFEFRPILDCGNSISEFLRQANKFLRNENNGKYID